MPARLISIDLPDTRATSQFKNEVLQQMFETMEYINNNAQDFDQRQNRSSLQETHLRLTEHAHDRWLKKPMESIPSCQCFYNIRDLKTAIQMKATKRFSPPKHQVIVFQGPAPSGNGPD